MTAAEVLAELQRHGVLVQVDAGHLRTRPAGAVPEELRPALLEHRAELVDLVARTCPGCGVVDYLPLAGGWRRCWACGSRWGSGNDPGDPPGLEAFADRLGLAEGSSPVAVMLRQPGWSIGAVLACPCCGNRVHSTPPAGGPHRRCDGPRGCGHIWNPEETRG